MPSIEENRDAFATDRGWVDAGENWSAPWGGSQPQWYGTLLPRIAAFVPTDHLLEIAPGFGRFTRFLLPLCARYTGLDLSELAVTRCRERFRDASHAAFAVNDGFTLPGIPDGSVTFAFSFDSLVHAELEVIRSYAGELARVLARGAYGFVHHSNAGALAASGGEPFSNPHWRATTVSANLARAAFEEAGLWVVTQETPRWGAERPPDTMTLVHKPGPDSGTRPPTRTFENAMMDAEIAAARERGRYYRPVDAEISGP